MRRIPTAAPAMVALAALSACDLPTEAPILDQRWILPVERSTIAVDELLPSGVTVSGDAFVVELDAFARTETLGDLCDACRAVDGLTVPKPAFQHTFSVNESLPAQVRAATLERATIAIQITHDLGFDPLRPGLGNTGTLELRLRNGPGGPVLATLVLDGASQGLPTGTTTQKTLTLDGAEVGTTLSMEVSVNSPEGDPTTIDTDNALTVTATPSAILASSATVEVAGRPVATAPVDLDVADIDDGISDRIQSGAVVLDVTNPFGVGVSGELVIEYPGGEITRDLVIGAGSSSTVRLTYSGDELRTFLGQTGVSLTGTATVDPDADPITVTPGQEVSMEGELDVTIRIGD